MHTSACVYVCVCFCLWEIVYTHIDVCFMSEIVTLYINDMYEKHLILKYKFKTCYQNQKKSIVVIGTCLSLDTLKSCFENTIWYKQFICKVIPGNTKREWELGKLRKVIEDCVHEWVTVVINWSFLWDLLRHCIKHISKLFHWKDNIQEYLSITSSFQWLMVTFWVSNLAAWAERVPMAREWLHTGNH